MWKKNEEVTVCRHNHKLDSPCKWSVCVRSCVRLSAMDDFNWRAIRTVFPLWELILDYN